MADKKLKPLSDKQERFIAEYLIDLSATQAAIRAGYKSSGARASASENLAVPEIRERIDAARARLAANSEITAEKVLKEYGRIAFADIRKMMEWDAESASFVPSQLMDDDTAAAVQSVKAKTRHTYDKEGNRETTIELEIKAHSKQAALDSISRTLGTYAPEKMTITLDQAMKIVAGASDAEILAATGEPDNAD